jgi:hypothetical protein
VVGGVRTSLSYPDPNKMTEQILVSDNRTRNGAERSIIEDMLDRNRDAEDAHTTSNT